MNVSFTKKVFFIDLYVFFSIIKLRLDGSGHSKVEKVILRPIISHSDIADHLNFVTTDEDTGPIIISLDTSVLDRRAIIWYYTPTYILISPIHFASI